jgi:hypothetical protein
MHMISHTFYGHTDYTPPDATIADVEQVLLNGGVDCDGIGKFDWLTAIMEDDTADHLVTHILKHKDDPAIKPLYKMVREVISGILDKDY